MTVSADWTRGWSSVWLVESRGCKKLTQKAVFFLLLLFWRVFRVEIKVTDGCFFRGYSFTGISPEASQALTEKAHVYLTTNGRISMAGLNTHNVRYFAESLDKAVRGQL